MVTYDICISFSDRDEISKHIKSSDILDILYKKFLQHFSLWPYLGVLSALFLLHFYIRNGTRSIYFEVSRMRINTLSSRISFVKQTCLGIKWEQVNLMSYTRSTTFVFFIMIYSFHLFYAWSSSGKHMFIEGRIMN